MRSLVEIQESEKSPERFELAHRFACVMRGGRRELLPARDCPSESHLLHLEPAPEGVLVEVPKNAPGAFHFEGNTLRSALVPWGGEVFWEQRRLSFLQEPEAKKASPLVFLVPLVALVIAGVAVAGKSPARGAEDSEVAAPSLSALAPPACSTTDGPAALRLARESERAARVKREQFAFELADGPRAVGLLGEAKACYEAAGAVDEQARVETDGASFRQQVSERYAALRLRLQVARDQRRTTEALAAARELRRLLQDHPGPYVTWLDKLCDELERQQRRAGS
jgi:hypothetical protein